MLETAELAGLPSLRGSRRLQGWDVECPQGARVKGVVPREAMGLWVMGLVEVLGHGLCSWGSGGLLLPLMPPSHEVSG